jgi:hypothetical protein
MVYTPSFYNAADQKIYNEGTYFKPQERFTLPYNQIPTGDENSVEPEGILSANVVNNNGNNGNQFSVYNPDPNTISNSNYNEDPYKSYLYRDRFPMMGDPVANQATGALNADGLMSYAGDKPRSKFLEMLSQGINLIPGANMAKKGLEYLGDMLPTNRRAIFENELAGQGVRVNNIGQIVQGQGDYNTAENIMAGYNASKINADTFSKRRGTIENTLGSKYDLTASQIEAARNNPNYKGPGSNLIDRLGALDASQENILGTATDRANIIYADEEEEKNKNKKNTIVNRYITKKKETKAAQDAQDKAAQDAQDMVNVEAVKAAIKKAEAAKAATYYTPDGTPGGGAGQGIDISGAGTIRTGGEGGNNFQGDSGPSNQQQSDSGYGSDAGFSSAPSRSSSYSSSRGSNFGGRFHGADGGRTGYFFGGRVNYKIGGRVGFKNGGLASIL